MNLSRFIRHGLASLALIAPFAHAAAPVTLVVGDQNYYNVRASVEASGVLKDYQGTADFLVQTGALPNAFDTQSVIDTSFGNAFH